MSLIPEDFGEEAESNALVPTSQCEEIDARGDAREKDSDCDDRCSLPEERSYSYRFNKFLKKLTGGSCPSNIKRDCNEKSNKDVCLSKSGGKESNWCSENKNEGEPVNSSIRMTAEEVVKLYKARNEHRGWLNPSWKKGNTEAVHDWGRPPLKMTKDMLMVCKSQVDTRRDDGGWRFGHPDDKTSILEERSSGMTRQRTNVKNKEGELCTGNELRLADHDGMEMENYGGDVNLTEQSCGKLRERISIDSYEEDSREREILTGSRPKFILATSYFSPERSNAKSSYTVGLKVNIDSDEWGHNKRKEMAKPIIYFDYVVNGSNSGFGETTRTDHMDIDTFESEMSDLNEINCRDIVTAKSDEALQGL